jgi:hypothetical protein
MLGLLAEVAVAITTADIGGVLAVRGWPIEVALQGGRVSDVELAREVHDRGARYVPRVD